MTRRRRRWLVALGILLVLRAALPAVLRAVLASRAAKLLNARVAIGDVDLGLLRGVVVLEDVAVRAPLPPGAAPPPAVDAEPPLVAWKRFAVNVAWLSLLRKTVRLESVELDEPRIALDRLASGDLNLAALAPKGKAAAGPTEGETAETQPARAQPATKPGAGWGFGIDSLVLRAGHARFRDFAVEGAEPVEIALPTLAVRDVALRPGLYGGPAHAHLDVRVDRGRLRVNTRLRLREDGLAVASRLRARRLPLRRTRVYVPKVGWRQLAGELGASVVHRFATGGRHLLRGTVTLDDVEIRVPEVEMPALAWKHCAVAVDPIDLVAERAAVASVELRGASLVVRPRGGPLLPMIGGEAETPPHPAPEPSAPAPAAPAPAAKPWRWSVGSLRVADTRLYLLGAEPATEVGVDVEASELTSDGDEPAPVRLALGLLDGSLRVEGGLRIARPGFTGTLTLDRLSLPELAGLAGALPPGIVQKGVLGAELALAAGSSAPTPGDVRVQGKVTLADPWVAAADPNDFAAGWSVLEVGIDELLVPGVLGADGAKTPGAPISVRLGAVSLAKPYAQLTRTAEGLVLPPLSSARAGDETPAAPAPGPAAGGQPPAPAVDVAVESLRLTEGRILVTDRTVTPFFWGDLTSLDADVQKLRWPALAMERVRVEATAASRGKLLLTGGFSPAGGEIQLDGRDIALRPFNPYATAYSPYSIASGALTVATRARFQGGGYDSTTALKLLQFDLGGKEGDTLFAGQFGIPLSVALALLKDLEGKIALDVPVAADAEGMKVGITSVIRQALRGALIGALVSPLKLVGAAFATSGGDALAPVPITFRAGRAELTAEGEKQAEALAGVVASRPGIGLTLDAPPSAEDVRWLREQALREELGTPQGVLGVVRTLPQRGARERIRTALEARARDEKGDLAADDAETLERWLAERPPPTPERLRALAGERMARLQALLRERYGIGPERVDRRDPAAEVAEGPPAVRFEMRAAAAPRGP